MKKTLVLGITMTFAALTLVACTGTSQNQDSSAGVSVEATVETTATAAAQTSEVKEAATEATVEAATEATSEVTASTDNSAVETSSEGVSFEKVDQGTGSENAIDSASVDVSVGEPYDNDPVPVPTDPTAEDR